MKILIIYGTTEGQTRKIAGYLKEEAVSLGNHVILADATENPPLSVGYDLVLIGASVHMHKYQSAVVDYVKKNAAALNKIRSAFFSVSMAAASGDAGSQKEMEEVESAFLKDTGWNPTQVEQVAGALKYTQYDFFKKLVMRLISKRHRRSTDPSEDHEYTDWEKLNVFLKIMLTP